MSGPKILVFGDVMLDVYRVCSPGRIAPEAPTPVLAEQERYERLGGAAAVASMLNVLGANVTLAAVVGDDAPGLRLVYQCQQHGIATLMPRSGDRPTTVKERIVTDTSIGVRQQIARVDTESRKQLSAETVNRLKEMLLNNVYDLIIVSDYGKGACSTILIGELLRTGTSVYVDPPLTLGQSWIKYRRAHAMLPNRRELNGTTPTGIVRRYELRDACVAKYDRDGAIFASGRSEIRYPARKSNVVDTTGAGDQFLAAIAFARASGQPWHDSCRMAITAAGLQVERYDCVPVTLDDIAGDALASDSTAA